MDAVLEEFRIILFFFFLGDPCSPLFSYTSVRAVPVSVVQIALQREHRLLSIHSINANKLNRSISPNISIFFAS